MIALVLALLVKTRLKAKYSFKPTRKTRHMHNRHYTPIYARTNIFKFSFVPRTIRDWNNLPHNVVEIADDAKFRKLLLTMIL